MRTCELCGAETGEGESRCPRCGFEFPPEIRSDIRDKDLLERHGSKSSEALKKGLRDRQNKLKGHLENLDTGTMGTGELNALIDEGLGFLGIPMAIGIGDELIFSECERGFIILMSEKVADADRRVASPVASSRSYVRLANALNCLGETALAMEMVDKALLIEPNSADALFGKAKLLFYGKKYEAAKRHLDKLISKKASPKAVYLAELIEQLTYAGRSE